MANTQEFFIYSHENIYLKNNFDNTVYDRKIKVYLALPSYSTNEDTGILLFNSGFGFSPSLTFFKDFRELVADKHNLIVIQSETFGHEFMISPSKQLHISEVIDIKNRLAKVFTNIELDNLFPQNKFFSKKIFQELSQKKDFQLNIPIKSKEKLVNFDDMSFMQALDLINAVLNTINLLYEQNFKFNSKKIISFGMSHGAYLSYLVNAFFPTLLSLIIDNCAWIYPRALEKLRTEFYESNNSSITFVLEDFAVANKNTLKIIKDPQALNLKCLYRQFINTCKIISYHGESDKIETYENKYDFLKNVENSKLYKVKQDHIDDKLFTSTEHALGIGSLNQYASFFQLCFEDKLVQFEKSTTLEFIDKVSFTTDQATYEINYEDIFPKLSIKELKNPS